MRTHERFVAAWFALAACSSGNATAVPGEGVSTIDGSNTAQYTICSSALSGQTFDNVKVEAGSSCTLDNVTVLGNLIALEAARLSVRDSRINGNIQGDKAAVVNVTGGVVGGSIQIQDGSSPAEDGVSITGGTILPQGNIQVTKMRTGRIVIADALLGKGNLQIEENEVSGTLDVLRNRVAQNLEVRKHQTGAAKTVSNNTVGEKLACGENASPFVASANSARDSECP